MTISGYKCLARHPQLAKRGHDYRLGDCAGGGEGGRRGSTASHSKDIFSADG
jgi:hypothetical protein